MSYRRQHIHPKIHRLQHQKKHGKIFLLLSFLLLAALCIVIGYGVFFWPQLQVTTIEISGNETIANDALKNTVWASMKFMSMYSKSILVANTSAIEKNLLGNFPDIKSVRVEKQMPHIVAVKIIQRKPYADFCQDKNSAHQCFVLDDNGVLYQPLENNLQNMMTIILPPGGPAFSLGDTVVPKNTIATIVKIQKNLHDSFQLAVANVLISNPLVLETAEHWKLYIDPSQDIDMQITKMDSILTSQVSETARKNLQYIYLQYKDRAYYK